MRKMKVSKLNFLYRNKKKENVEFFFVDIKKYYFLKCEYPVVNINYKNYFYFFRKEFSKLNPF